MRAVEGSLLVVDASQGVEAQTLANVYHAMEADHEIVPVLNKSRPACGGTRPRLRNRSKMSSASMPSDAVHISAKTGIGIPDVLGSHCHTPSSRTEGTSEDAPLKAMLVDSWYDAYLGVVVLVRVIDGFS